MLAEVGRSISVLEIFTGDGSGLIWELVAVIDRPAGERYLWNNELYEICDKYWICEVWKDGDGAGDADAFLGGVPVGEVLGRVAYSGVAGHVQTILVLGQRKTAAGALVTALMLLSVDGEDSYPPLFI